MAVMVSSRHQGIPPFTAGVHRDLVPLKAVAEWCHLVRCSVAGVTIDQAHAIAQLCNAAEAKGENCSTWHQSAIFFGRSDRCNCALCRKAQGAPAGAFRYHSVSA